MDRVSEAREKPAASGDKKTNFLSRLYQALTMQALQNNECTASVSSINSELETAPAHGLCPPSSAA